MADSKGKLEVVSTLSGGRSSTCPLPGAHGVVWDDARHGVWGLGTGGRQALRFFKYSGTRGRPNLLCASPENIQVDVPGGGHSLAPMCDGSRRLAIAAGRSILWYDTQTGNQHTIAGNPKTERLRGISYNPLSGEYLYVVNDSDFRGERVWSLFEGKDSRNYRTREYSGGLYKKARWFFSRCAAWPNERS